MQPKVIVFNWFENEEEYKKLLSVADDKTNLPDTFFDWEQKALKNFKNVPSGVKPIKINIKVDELVTWCKTRGLKIDGRNRSAFAQDLAISMAKRGDIIIEGITPTEK